MSVVEGIEFTPDEISLLDDLQTKATESSLKEAIMESIPNFPPSLVIKLQQDPDSLADEKYHQIASELGNIMDETVNQAKDTLKELLDAGEIRKLDNLIGKAYREGRINVAFFNVLQANLQDAAQGDEDEQVEEGSASRMSILTHIHTRCQEEVEKNIPPGVALFNKLLRTEQPSIRRNIYDHYLGPKKTVIESPDGQKIELPGDGAPLVSHELFVTAIADAVKQIRTVEASGGTTKEAAANMVESCRSVAKEARIVIGETFGQESGELAAFEEGLQPVFRPPSSDSPFIKGQT